MWFLPVAACGDSSLDYLAIVSLQTNLRKGRRHRKYVRSGYCSVPQRFLVFGGLLWRVQLRHSQLSRKNYGQLRENQYAYEQAAIL
jgi:hypothetical protein